MFKSLSVEDFAVLRGPLESGRQSPQSLASALVLGSIMQAFVFFVIYDTPASNSVYPNINTIKDIHFWITTILIGFSIVYAVPYIYKRSQTIQYLLSILVIQNVGAVCMFLVAVFFIGAGSNINQEKLINITNTTLVIATILFFITSIRFYILLKKGHYRKGTQKDRVRAFLEDRTTDYITYAVVGGTSVSLLVTYLFRMQTIESLDSIFLIVLPLLIFYTMIFVLPEQLVILYCKFRFKSFNFDRNGYLYSEPVSAKDKSLRV